MPASNHTIPGRIPKILQGYEPRPFDRWVLQAKELGFNLLTYHDADAFTVHIRLEPMTRATKTAVDRVIGDHHPDNAIEAQSCYDVTSKDLRASGIEPPPREDQAKYVAIGFDDAASEALRLAEEALNGDR